MRSHRRALQILVFAIPLILVGVISYRAIREYYGGAEKNLAPIIAAELGDAIGHEVRIGKVSIARGHAYLDDVHVSERATFATSGGRELASVHHAVVDFDLRTLLQADAAIPYFSSIEVLDPVAHLARDATGRWNFADIFQPHGKPPARQSVGRVVIINGTVTYADAQGPHNPKRPAEPISARLEHVKGHLHFSSDRSIDWQVSGTETSGVAHALDSLGSYDPATRRLFIRATTDRVVATLANRFLPPGQQVWGGAAAGTITVFGAIPEKGAVNLDYVADARATGLAVRSDKLAEPISGSGEATVTPDVITAKLDGSFAGSRLHAEGTLLNPADPVVHGWATGGALRLDRALAALKLEKRFPALRDIAATASLRAEFAGRPNSLQVAAAGAARAAGAIQNGPSVAPSELQVTLSGPLADPRFTAAGTLASVRFRRYEARNVFVSAAYNGTEAAADFSGRVAGGVVSGRAAVTPRGKQTAYAVNLAARGVDLARLPRAKDQPPTAGVADADISARGRFDQKTPQGEARARVARLRVDRWSAAIVDVRGHTEGDTLLVSSAVVQDPAGYALASGSVDLRKGTVDLAVDADDVDLASLPLQTDPSAQQIEGTAYLRDGRVTGRYDDPAFGGSVRGYGLAAGERMRLDFASARLDGTRDQVTITNGQAWRFPAFAEGGGTLSALRSSHPQLALSGDFARVDLQDLADMTHLDLQASGTATGEWSARGELSRPIVAADPVTIIRPTVDRWAFDRLTAAILYDGTRPPGVLHVRSFEANYSRAINATKPDVVIRGFASITPSEGFTAHVQTGGVSLALAEQYLPDYAILKGTGDLSADISGTFVEGKVGPLAGTMTAGTTGLRVNDADLGDLIANLRLEGNEVTGSLHPKAAGAARNGLYVDDFHWDRATDQMTAKGELTTVNLETIRRAVMNSPYVARNQDSVAAGIIKPLNPLGGSLRLDFDLSGTGEKPRAAISWTSQRMVIEEQPIDSFTGTAIFSPDHVEIAKAALKADDTSVSAAGTYKPSTDDLTASADLNNMPLRILRRWFPGVRDLNGLTGTADDISLHASGHPADPRILATVNLSGVRWQDPDPARKLFAGLPIDFPNISTSTITAGGGKLAINDLGIKVLEPDRSLLPKANPLRPATDIAGIDPKSASPESVARSVPATAPARPGPRASYEAHASLSMDFQWAAPVVPAGANAEIRVSIRNQALQMITAFLPGANVTLDGQIREASLHYDGPLEQLTDPRTFNVDASGAPKLSGVLSIAAARIASPDTSTELRDLDTRLVFDADNNVLHVDHFTANTQVVNPRYTSRKSKPLVISGDLPINRRGRAAGLTVSAPSLVVAEAPIPRIGAGSVVGEVSTDDLRTPQVEALQITGTLFYPHVAGTIYARNTILNLPSSFETAASTPVALPILPSFDLRFVADRDVRVNTAQLNASVHTAELDPIALTGRISDLKLTGSLVVDRGSITFPTSRFTLRRGGTVSLRYPYAVAGALDDRSLGILVNLSATTRITATSVAGVRKRYTITVDAQGPLNGPNPVDIGDQEQPLSPFGGRGLQLTFRSDPPDLALSSTGLQQRVTELVGGRAAIEDLFSRNPNFGRVVSEQISSALSQAILPGIFERSGIAQALGLEEFEIEYNQLDAFTLRISRQLFGPFYLGYWRRLSGVNRAGLEDRSAWEFRLSYHIRDNLQFTYTFNEQRQNAYLIEGVFRFR